MRYSDIVQFRCKWWCPDRALTEAQKRSGPQTKVTGNRAGVEGLAGGQGPRKCMIDMFEDCHIDKIV